MWWFLGILLVLACLVAAYVARRDRGRGPGTGPFVEDGEGKSAAYLSGMDRGMDGGM